MKGCKRQLLASLLLLVLQFTGCKGGPTPSIDVVYPETHSVWRVNPLTGAVAELVVALAIQNFRVPEHGVVHITGEKIGDYSKLVVHSLPTPLIRLRRVESGSHFWTFALVHSNGSVAAHTTLHVEIVLQQDTALPQWHYTPNQQERRPKILINLPRRTDSTQRHTLCVVGTTSGTFDGQKKIWLQSIAALPQQAWNVRFVAFESIVDASPFVDRLRRLNVSIQSFPLTVSWDELNAHGLTASQAMPTTIQAYHETFQVNEPSLQAFHDCVESLHPPFAARLWQQTVDALHQTCDDAVLVMANARNVADQLLVTAARIAGVRAVVMELANLWPVPLRVDALVAPSHFALYHPSVVETVAAHQRYVLNTGVNTTLFRPPPTAPSANTSNFVVGYVGRLSTDKSVGLVLGAARLLATSCPQRCSVRIVGDGPLRAHLESLVVEWQLTEMVTFTGGIYSERLLARELQQWDVALSPCFHETFGIAPLEAMSCSVPVVAFASGGVLEYLEHTVNGIVVQESTAKALYDAISLLRDNSDLRHRLGDKARRTVVRRFAHHVGVQQFVRLYERLAQS